MNEERKDEAASARQVVTTRKERTSNEQVQRDGEVPEGFRGETDGGKRQKQSRLAGNVQQNGSGSAEARAEDGLS